LVDSYLPKENKEIIGGYMAQQYAAHRRQHKDDEEEGILEQKC